MEMWKTGEIMILDKDNIRKIRGLIVFTIFVLVGLWKFDVVWQMFRFVWKILFPFVLGGAIAFFIHVPMELLERKVFSRMKLRWIRRWKRPISLSVTLILIAGVLAAVGFIVVPKLGETIASLHQQVERIVPELQRWIGIVRHRVPKLSSFLVQVQSDENVWFNSQAIWQQIFLYVQSRQQEVLDSTVQIAKNIVHGVILFFIAFSFACYILMQKERLREQMRLILYAFVRKGRAEAIEEVCALTYQTFYHFLTGQCVEALILGTMFVITMFVLRIPYALLIGIVIAFTALVPIFGAFVGCAFGIVLIVIVDPVKALWFLILFLVLQQIEGDFIYPHVVGNSVGLPSIWVLAAVTIGGSMMGATGMLIFIPIVSVLYALFREIVYLKVRKRKLEEGEEKNGTGNSHAERI